MWQTVVQKEGEGEGMGAGSFCSDIVRLESGFRTGEVNASHSIVSDSATPWTAYSP